MRAAASRAECIGSGPSIFQAGAAHAGSPGGARAARSPAIRRTRRTECRITDHCTLFALETCRRHDAIVHDEGVQGRGAGRRVQAV
eukprot:scaffold6767_cov223-Isochrysis_galbana.AAC.16